MSNVPESGQPTFAQALTLAQSHWQAGQAAHAEDLCQRVLAASPGHPDALHMLGLIAHAYGKLDLAILHLAQACQSPSAPPVYHANLAEMLRQKGQLEDAEAAARRAVTMDGNLVSAWNNLGIVLQEQGKLEESLVCLERVAALKPDWADIHNNLGNTCRRLDRLADAEVYYRKALALKPDYANALSNFAALLRVQGRLDEALELARRAIEIEPQFVDAYLNLADIELARNNAGGALQVVDVLCSFAPRHPAALLGRAKARFVVGLLDDALASAREASTIAPHSSQIRDTLAQIEAAIEARNARGDAPMQAPVSAANVADFADAEARARDLINAKEFAAAEVALREATASGTATITLWKLLAVSMRSQGKIEEAKKVQAMIADKVPGDLSNRFDLSETLLLLGEFERGWREYRYRYSLEHTMPIERKVQRPRWDGQPIPGKTLLIHDEQGYGDTFQFLRLANRARERSQARVILQVNGEALTIAKRMWGEKDIVARGGLPIEFDLHCELMSLPMAMGLTQDDLPGPMPYLSPDPARVEHWRARLADVPRPWVATVWAGRPEHVNDANRSVSLEQLAPLGASGASFLAVQKGPSSVQAATAPAGMNVVSLSDEIRDFEDTAAILSLADLLISVDSSPVHLAGAMGRPVWVLLPFVPDWRWLMDREDTPWYPDMRLFRQAERAEWTPVIERMARELGEFVAQWRTSQG